MRKPSVAIPLRGPSFIKLLLMFLSVSLLFPYGFLRYFSQLIVEGYNLLPIIITLVFDNFVIIMVVLLQDLNSIVWFKYFLLRQLVPMIASYMASAYLHLREFVIHLLGQQSYKTHLIVLLQFDTVLSILVLVFCCTTIL